jgi:hypothetical protein
VAQAYYEAITEKTIDAYVGRFWLIWRHKLTLSCPAWFIRWTESQLREYLLEHGIISPSGTLEEMRIAAKQK